MSIQGAFQDIPQSFNYYCHTTQQATMSVILKLKELRNDPEFFLKICQIATASLQLIIAHYPDAAFLSRFSFVFTTADMHNFYRFLRRPYQWFCPVSTETIDENLVLKDLTQFIYRKLKDNVSVDDEWADVVDDYFWVDLTENKDDHVENKDNHDSENEAIDSEDFNTLNRFLRECLNVQLERMRDNYDYAYRDLDKFKDDMSKCLKQADFDKHQFDNITFDELSAVMDDLSALNANNEDYHVAQWIRHETLAETITKLNWAIVDIGCVGLYLEGWKLLDAAKWTERIGQYPGFQWVKNQQLDRCVLGLVCTAYAWQLFEAARKLHDQRLQPLTKQESRQAKWNVITSTAELILWGSVFLNQIGQTQFNNAYLQWLAIGAKSLGLLSIVVQPKHEFFQQPQSAPAA